MRFAIILTAATLVASAAHAAPLAAYGKLATMEDVTISPDGTKVAFAQVVDGKQAVVIDQLEPAAIVAEFPPTDQKVRGLRWADNTHLLVMKSRAGYYAGAEVNSAFGEFYLVYSFDIAKKKVTALYSHQDQGPRSRITSGDTLNTVGGMPDVRMVKGQPVAFAQGQVMVDGIGVHALLSADLDDGAQTVLDRAGQYYQGGSWLVDGAGAPLARTTYDQKTHDWSLEIKRPGGWVETYAVKASIETPQVRGFSADGASLLLQLVKDNGYVETRPLSLADGKLGAPIADYDSFDTLLRDPATQRVIGGVKIGLEPTYVFFDPKDQANWAMVLKAYDGEQVDPVSWSQDRSKMVVRVTGGRSGVIYAVVDLTTRKVTPIGEAYTGITANDVADVNIASYKAADGAKIDAFLTMPIGREPKNLPLIVLPHGGPGARDESGFDWWAQALASRGYAVLQPQFRGSADLGWDLEQAGFGQWGRKMQSDLSDGVRALAAAGMIDPKRVCIVGGSYGGYAALAGVTLEQGVYRCAVSYAGISDMHRMLNGGWSAWIDADKSSNARYMDRFVGAKDPNDPVYDQISPIRHVDKASVPVLLIHGRSDSVVPYEQSVLMNEAMQKAGKQVEFLTLPDEDHWLSRDATRQQMLQATVTFLEKYNPPK
jgi:dipeptidyl aminopeptidase/acylaminoacyl peptidase